MVSVVTMNGKKVIGAGDATPSSNNLKVLGTVATAGPAPKGLGSIVPLASVKRPADPAVALSAQNKSILKGLGIDLDTVLTPRGKRKKSAQLRGQEPGELTTELGG